MKHLSVGDAAPAFCLPDSDDKSVCLGDLSGKWIVLYFYPKDNTSGCTLEAITFSQQLEDFTRLNATILGVSPDSPKSHCGFRDKHNLAVTLLSDGDQTVLKQYDSWVLKKMYGKKYFGVERSTFLIDPEGKIAAIWRKVKVPGHIEEVKNRLKELQA